MHFKNGREAKVGDTVVARDCNGTLLSGVVVKTNTQSDTCNLVIQPIVPNQFVWASAKECLHADDALPVTEPAK